MQAHQPTPPSWHPSGPAGLYSARPGRAMRSTHKVKPIGACGPSEVKVKTMAEQHNVSGTTGGQRHGGSRNRAHADSHRVPWQIDARSTQEAQRLWTIHVPAGTRCATSANGAA
jgi:hypothetical protein